MPDTDHNKSTSNRPTDDHPLSRRGFLREGAIGLVAGAVGLTLGVAAARGRRSELVWQLDPQKCIQCGRCATECVLEPSAVKCVHNFSMCGRCDLCFGFFDPKSDIETGAENQLCPTGAIRRTFLTDPYYEYTIDESLCIGCSRCVQGCLNQGNGSLFLQVRHDRCLNCNECAIARVCPADAFRRVPAETPYIVKTRR